MKKLNQVENGAEELCLDGSCIVFKYFLWKLIGLIVNYTTVEKAESREYNLNNKEELYIAFAFWT